MRLTLIVVTSLSCVACVRAPIVSDHRAIAPEHDRWEARVSAPPSIVFGIAMETLADSGYSVQHADASTGIIGTNLRSVAHSGSTRDYRLHFMILPVGADSARVVVRGELCLGIPGASPCYPRHGYDDDWFIVRHLGESILRRLEQR